MCLAESDRDKWRGIIDEIAAVLHPGAIYNSNEFPQEVAALKAELSHLRAKLATCGIRTSDLRAALSAAEVARDAFASENAEWRERDADAVEKNHNLVGQVAELEAEVEQYRDLLEVGRRQVRDLRAEVERLKVRDLEWQAIFPGCFDPPDLDEAVRELRGYAQSQERATGEFAAQVLTLSEATSATIREGQANRNAVLRQRVFEHIGNLILNEKAGWGGLPDLVAQFDLLGRDL